MPEYEVITKTIIERSYRLKLELPVDMGSATERLTDKKIRTAAENTRLDLTQSDIIDSGSEGEEEVTFIYRNNIQIWPRPRKKTDPILGTKTFGKSSKTPAPDLEDVAVEDKMSSETEE